MPKNGAKLGASSFDDMVPARLVRRYSGWWSRAVVDA
jgi:hypothetical protein